MMEKNTDREEFENRIALDEAMYQAISESSTDTRVTVKYDRSILEDKKKLDDFKKQAFGEKKTIKNDYGKGNLHSSHKSAKNLYGKNASYHQAEVDHIVPVKNVHGFATSLNYVSDAEVKDVINKNSNYKVIDKHTNASKQDQTNFEYVKEHPELSAEEKAKMIKDGILAGTSVYGELVVTDLKNAGKEALTNTDTFHSISVNSASVQLALVLEGKKTIPEAVIDTSIMIVKGEITNVLLTEGLELGHITLSEAERYLVKHIGKKSAEKVLGEVTSKAIEFVNENMGDIVFCAMEIGSAVKQFANGEISGEELILMSAQKVATQYTMKIGQKLGGTLGEFALTPIVGPVIGKFVGEIVGGAVGYIVGNTVVSLISSVNELTKSKHIEEIINEFAIINAQLDAYLQKLNRVDIDRAFGLLNEISTLNTNIEQIHSEIELIEKLYTLLDIKGIQMQFTNHLEFKKFMKSNEPLIL